MAIMNEIEKQNYIRFATRNIQKLSDIVLYASEIMKNYSINVRLISDYCSENDLESNLTSTKYLLLSNDEYKTFILDSGELK